MMSIQVLPLFDQLKCRIMLLVLTPPGDPDGQYDDRQKALMEALYAWTQQFAQFIGWLSRKWKVDPDAVVNEFVLDAVTKVKQDRFVPWKVEYLLTAMRFAAQKVARQDRPLPPLVGQVAAPRPVLRPAVGAGPEENLWEGLDHQEENPQDGPDYQEENPWDGPDYQLLRSWDFTDEEARVVQLLLCGVPPHEIPVNADSVFRLTLTDEAVRRVLNAVPGRIADRVPTPLKDTPKQRKLRDRRRETLRLFLTGHKVADIADQKELVLQRCTPICKSVTFCWRTLATPSDVAKTSLKDCAST